MGYLYLLRQRPMDDGTARPPLSRAEGVSCAVGSLSPASSLSAGRLCQETRTRRRSALPEHTARFAPKAV